MRPNAHPHRRVVPTRARRLLAALLLALALLHLPTAAPAQAPLPGPGADAEVAEETSVADALRLLAIVLEDPEARGALVEQLRAVEPAEGAGAPPAAEPLAEPTVPEIIVEETLSTTERAVEQVVGVVSEIASVSEILARIPEYDFARAWADARPVLVLIAVVLAALWLVRLAYRPLLNRFARGAEAAPSALRRWRWRIAGLLAEAARVLFAWTVGHALALYMGGGDIAPAHRLFLDAFLVVEGARILPRTVFRPGRRPLRVVDASDSTAQHWFFWTGRILGVLGYGTLFLAPLAALLQAPRTGQWLTLVSVLLAMAMTIGLVLRNREPVRDALQQKLAGARTDIIAAWLYPLAHYWHLIVIGYTLALFVVWRAVPWNALGFMIRATILSGLLVLVGSLLIALISRRIAGGITVSERTRRNLPLLETRLNRFVPAALQVARVLSAVIVIAGILTVWGIVDAIGWLSTSAGRTVGWSFLWISAVLLFAGTIYLLVSSWIEYRLNPELRAVTARERTLLALLSNAFVVVLAIITVMTVLTQMGIDIAPLLAGAGVIGLAIGFGSQKLVQDIINGVFIQLENTMNEGDVVTAGPITGGVEKLTIRSVSLRDFNGVVHVIPFSSVDTVSNFTKTFSFHVADIGVAYREDIDAVKQAMEDAFDLLMETEHRAEILPPFEQFGVERFADSAVIVRARIKTLPGKQWGVGRAYNEIVKRIFDERGIEMPFPHRTLYMGADKAGSAPPLNVRNLAETPAAEAPATDAPRAAPSGMPAPL